MNEPTPLHWRLLRIVILLGVAALLGMAAGRTRQERIAYSALQTGLALIGLGSVFWLFGKDVSGRPFFIFRCHRYTGREVVSFGYGFMAGGVAFALLGLWCLALWLAPGLARP
nr:hypothetical protein [Nitrospirota bacterium]